MSEHARERLAWAFLLASFATCSLLSITIPLGLRWWIINSSDAQSATLQVIEGTVLVGQRGVGTDVSSELVQEGSTIRTDANSRAILTLFDDVGSITIFPSSELQLIRLRSPTFGLSPQPNLILLRQNGGRIRINAAPPSSRATEWQVITPQGRAFFQEGSHAVEVTNDASEIAVRNGQARVEAGSQSLTLEAGDRAILPRDGPLEGPLPAGRNLVVNGDFSRELEGWMDRPSSNPAVPQGQTQVVLVDGRPALHIRRLVEGDTNHTETGQRQVIDPSRGDVSDFLKLQLRLDVRIDFHDLGGGGAISTEYPVIVRVDYLDEFGSPNHFYRGFYYQNEVNNPTVYGKEVRQGVWVPFEETFDLESGFDPDGDLQRNPRPDRILSLEVYASGWNYDSLVAEIELVAE